MKIDCAVFETIIISKMGYIYKITNRISGKIYIGKTTQVDPDARWKMDRKELGKKVTESEKYKKAIAEGRVGGSGHKSSKLSEETKDKIRESVSKYYEQKGEGHQYNIEKHREAMAKGRKVDQFDKDGNFIKTYVSVSDAERNIGISGIRFAATGKYKTAGGFVWKYHIDKESKMETAENEIIYES